MNKISNKISNKINSEKYLRIAGTSNDSITDGPGIRFTVFAQGCFHNCKNCHNPQTHDINSGKLVLIQEILDKLKLNPLLDGLTISGGEPFLQSENFAILAIGAKKLGLNIITYTGFLYQDLIINPKYNKLVFASDYIIDGLFEEELKSLELNFKGSSNQRIIDVKKSIENNIVWEIKNFEY